MRLDELAAELLEMLKEGVDPSIGVMVQIGDTEELLFIDRVDRYGAYGDPAIIAIT